VFQLSSVSCCTTCECYLYKVTCARNFQMCRRLNDFQDWILSRSRILYEWWWPRFTVVKPCVKMAPSSWIFSEVKSEGKTVLWTLYLVSVPNFVRICSTITELWPLKKNFKMADAAILDFPGIEFWQQIGLWSMVFSPCIIILCKYMPQRPIYSRVSMWSHRRSAWIWRQKTRVLGLRNGEETMTLAFFILTQYQRVTDGRTDRRTDTLRSLLPALA